MNTTTIQLTAKDGEHFILALRKTAAIIFADGADTRRNAAANAFRILADRIFHEDSDTLKITDAERCLLESAVLTWTADSLDELRRLYDDLGDEGDPEDYEEMRTKRQRRANHLVSLLAK